MFVNFPLLHSVSPLMDPTSNSPLILPGIPPFSSCPLITRHVDTHPRVHVQSILITLSFTDWAILPRGSRLPPIKINIFFFVLNLSIICSGRAGVLSGGYFLINCLAWVASINYMRRVMPEYPDLTFDAAIQHILTHKQLSLRIRTMVVSRQKEFCRK